MGWKTRFRVYESQPWANITYVTSNSSAASMPSHMHLQALIKIKRKVRFIQLTEFKDIMRYSIHQNIMLKFQFLTQKYEGVGMCMIPGMGIECVDDFKHWQRIEISPIITLFTYEAGVSFASLKRRPCTNSEQSCLNLYGPT